MDLQLSTITQEDGLNQIQKKHIKCWALVGLQIRFDPLKVF